MARPQILRDQMAGEPPAPGYLAYTDDVPVGWVGVGVRTDTPRLQRSRTIPAIDELPVWAIGCFRIRPGFRRRGIAAALLDGVIDAARRAGAPGVEAYPIDPEGGRVDVGAGYVGIASMFDAAGFRRVLVTSAHSGHLSRVLVPRPPGRSSGLERGRVGRLKSMSGPLTDAELRIVPANEASAEDVQLIFARSDAARCQCQWFRNTPAGHREATTAQRRERLHEQVHFDGPRAATTAGLVAYLDDEPVGWCAVAPRSVYIRLRNSRQGGVANVEEFAGSGRA